MDDNNNSGQAPVADPNTPAPQAPADGGWQAPQAPEAPVGGGDTGAPEPTTPPATDDQSGDGGTGTPWM